LRNEDLTAVINKPNAGVSAVTKGSAGDLPTNILHRSRKLESINVMLV
jgi:hypothetical protein